MEDWHRFALPRTSADEHARAALFYHTADAVRHLLGRALLRMVLSQELGAQALPASFPTNPWGKPQLPDSNFQFSISHSGDAVWLAITRETPVGIDVETVSGGVDPAELASILHPDERAEILSSSAHEAEQRFLRCWTRKEAVIKALGMGISCPLDSFRAATDSSPQDWLMQTPHAQVDEWTCADLPINDTYHLSVAAMAPKLSITCHYFELPCNSFALAGNECTLRI